MIDDNDFVPEEYKTAENVVLHPNKLPVFEIEISIKGSDLNLLREYNREYEYNEDMEVFIPTIKLFVINVI